MRAVISTTVAFIVALHTVLGCCWHHAHEAAAATTQHEEKPAEPAVKRCSCHHHRDEAKPVEQESPPQESHDSCPGPCDDKCDAPAVVRIQHDDVAVVSLFAPVATLDQPVPTPVVFTSHAALADEELQPPPIRLHLLHQLLLI